MLRKKKAKKQDDVRVHGNQYGMTIVIQGDLLEKVTQACILTGDTVEEFVIKAIMDKAEKVIADYESSLLKEHN